MRALFLAISILILVSACQERSPSANSCEASWATLNASDVERVLIVREVDGHDGYSLIDRGCEYFVPFSISPMTEDDRVKLNREIAELFRTDPTSTGIAFVEAQCKCSFDARTGIVSASRVSDLATYTGQAPIRP